MTDLPAPVALLLSRPLTSGVMMGLDPVPVMVTETPAAAACLPAAPPAALREVSMPVAFAPIPRLVSTFMRRWKLIAPEGATVP